MKGTFTALFIVVLILWGMSAPTASEAVSAVPTAEQLVRDQQDDPAATLSRDIDDTVPIDMGTERDPEPSWITVVLVETIRTIVLTAHRLPDAVAIVWALTGAVPAGFQLVISGLRGARHLGERL